MITLGRKVEHDFNYKSESRTFSILTEKSYNKTVIDFNFCRQKDLSTLKSDIHHGLSLFGEIDPHVYLIEVSNCILWHVVIH